MQQGAWSVTAGLCGGTSGRDEGKVSSGGEFMLVGFSSDVDSVCCVASQIQTSNSSECGTDARGPGPQPSLEKMRHGTNREKHIESYMLA